MRKESIFKAGLILTYYGVSGSELTLSRDYHMEYDSLFDVWLLR